MAEQRRTIFNAKASEKLRSPDDLEKYIRVTTPSAWAIVAACAALVLGLLAWGVFGAVSTNVSATGTCLDGQVLCFLNAEDAARVEAGDAANVSGAPFTVLEVSSVPLSREEAHERLGNDYLASTLMADDWAYLVIFEGEQVAELAEGIPLTIDITTERVTPISLILG